MKPVFEDLTLKFTGSHPGVLLDNGDRADPNDEIAKLTKSKSAIRAKDRTDQTVELLEDIAYLGGLYTSEKLNLEATEENLLVSGGGILVIPGPNVEKLIIEGARMRRLGKAAQSAFLFEPEYPLLINGSEMTAVEAYERRAEFGLRRRVGNRTGNKKSWVVIKRACFENWELTVTMKFFPKTMNREQIIECATLGGNMIGIGSYRPKYGRFTVEVATAKRAKAA